MVDNVIFLHALHVQLLLFLIKNVLKRVRLKQRRPGTEKWGTHWGTVNVEGKGTINDEDNYRSEPQIVIIFIFIHQKHGSK